MCPKDMDVPTWKTSTQIANAWKIQTQIANAISDVDGYGWTDRGNRICPFHHSLNGGGRKKLRNGIIWLKREKIHRDKNYQKYR